MADIWVDVDIALSEIPVNSVPLISSSDFITIDETIAYNEAGMDLNWNFITTSGAFTQTNVTPTTAGVHDWTHQGNGMYTIEIPAGSPGTIQNNAEGFGWFTGVCTGVLPWKGPTIGFRSATVNDALIDSDTFMTAKDVGLLYEAAISTVNSQTSFDLNVNIATDDNWIGQIITIDDVSTGDSWSTWVTDVVQASDRILINQAAPFTVITGDKVRVYKDQHPTYALNTYDPPTSAELTTAKSELNETTTAYFQLALRNDSAIATDRSTYLSAINTDEGSGVGSYTPTTESLSAIDASIGGLTDVTAAEVWSEVLGPSAGYSASALVQIIASAVSGKISGAGTSTITIRDILDTENTIVATVDASGNRTAITITTPGD